LFLSPGRRPPRPPRSFPTRRSSDLTKQHAHGAPVGTNQDGVIRLGQLQNIEHGSFLADLHFIGCFTLVDTNVQQTVGPALYQLRSEEHTSELQSRENLVCRLLLAKK